VSDASASDRATISFFMGTSPLLVERQHTAYHRGMVFAGSAVRRTNGLQVGRGPRAVLGACGAILTGLGLAAGLLLGGCVGAVGGGDGGADLDLAAPPGSDLAAPPGSDLAAPPLTLTPGDTTLTFMVAGMTRSVRVHAPAGVGGSPMGLVIALHGNGDTNANFVAAIGLASLADARGLVVAAPQGITQNISFMGQQLNGLSWDAYRSAAQGNIDLPLLDEIRTRLLSSGAIDPKRVFVFGYSQGGYLAFHHGMVAAAQLSCTAVIAATNPLPGSQLVPGAARKIPVALQIGANDGAVSGARATRDDLMARGFPVSYNEIANAGHVPFPGMPSVPLDYCNGQSLP